MKWHFSPQLPDQVETEVTQRDQFDNDEVDISETIVRESIQNSLDAAVDDPCRVKVTFRWVSKDEGLDPGFFRELFDGQLEHAKAADINVDNLDFDNPSALVIEDFGTCGLTGSVKNKDKNHFSDFWRRHGKSHKTGKSRGRWGLGKLVYSTTSQVGVFFGYTRRREDSESHLMGQAVLNLRTVNKKEYPPHAFFCDLENEVDIYSRTPVPVKNKLLVQSFVQNFSLKRDSDPGLSVVIPFPAPEFNVERMIGVAIANYFYPLITGQLVLQLGDVEINRNNVRALAKQYRCHKFDQIDLLFDFVEEIHQAEQGDLLELKPSWIDDRKLDEHDFDAETIETIREKFEKGVLVGLYLPVTIKFKGGSNKESGFSVYIKRPESLEKGHDLYVRGGLTLPGEVKFRERRALGAMIAEDEAICAFLGDAENAAHTQWTTNTEKLRKNYRNSQQLITLIKKSVVQLYDLLAEVTEEKDEDALQNFFWFDEPQPSREKRRKKPSPPSSIPLIKSRKRKYGLSKVKGGFTVVNAEEFPKEQTPCEVRIEVAYEVGRGNAFGKYSPHDFVVGKNGSINICHESSIKLISARENKWIFEVTEIPFKLTATGFDENRDLKVKIQ